MTDDFFRSRLDAMIDLRHPLVVLATRMPWAQIETLLAPLFVRRNREGQVAEDVDLFGSTAQLAGAGVSVAGRPRLSIRLLTGLLYLKHLYNLSDESVCERLAQDVNFQYYCGEACFQPHLPCSPMNLVRFRHALGEAGVDELLATTVAVAANMKAVTLVEFKHAIVESTVREKASAFPTDSRLLEVARTKLVQLARRAGLALKQTDERKGKQLHRVLKRQRTILGRMPCNIDRKLSNITESYRNPLELWLARAWQICRQRPKDRGKLYAPEVECIGKGKAGQPYEFGVKAYLTITEKRGLIVGARTFAGNPYDGHTLAEQLKQTRILPEGVSGEPSPKTELTDLGYRGGDATVAPVTLIHRGKCKTLSSRRRRWLKRRQAVEPVIERVKQDHGLKRCGLTGVDGQCTTCLLCAAGYNLRWLLLAIERAGYQAPFDATCPAIHSSPVARSPLPASTDDTSAFASRRYWLSFQPSLSP
ncbi:transposase [Burkholderia ubonensis]|uniref:IS5 family transposase n=1 Tax=Burkholderia ubonensis TaxID=101571 RepID=UPI0007598675|nr:IS5 family transposase [Burkholderia ubonensis]KVD66917.1 transposase [Burkholderia ubonensis]